MEDTPDLEPSQAPTPELLEEPDPTPSPPSDVYDSLPESVVASVMERWGYQDSESDEDEPDNPEADVAELPDEPDDSDLPSPPGGPIFDRPEPPPAASIPESPDSVRLPDGTVVPLTTVAQWALQAQAAQAPQPEPQSQPQSQYPSLPPLSEEDLADPAVRALVMVANAQQQKILELAKAQEQFAAQQSQVVKSNHAEVVEAAVTSFQRTYNLPDDLMAKIRANSQPDDLARHLQLHNNPYEAVEYALSRSYWDTPEARTFEFERQADNRARTQIRKQKLAGIGGSSGSGPRNAPTFDESTPEGRKAAAIEVVRQAMGLNE